MGLDMYLFLDKGRKGVKELKRILDSDKFWEDKWKKRDEFDGLTLVEWRKSFGILHWFDCNLESVKNQTITEEEDCGREGVQYSKYYKVEKDEFLKLYNLCSEINRLKEPNIPGDLLPVGVGYFCGAYEGINEWWWSDIKFTISEFEKAMNLIDWDSDDVYFHIS